MGLLAMLAKFQDRYGAMGFGVISLLIVWVFIVQPEMAENRRSAEMWRVQARDFEAADAERDANLRSALEQVEEISDSLRETASALRSTAGILSAVSERHTGSVTP